MEKIDEMDAGTETVEVCDNELYVEIGVVPVRGGKGYTVAKVSCPRLPFYGEMVGRQVQAIVRADPDDLGREVSTRLEAFAKELELKVSPKISINKDPKLTPKKDEVYDGGGYFNLFVDMGSTNAKWMIATANDNGATVSLSSMGMDKTTSVCAKFGIRYDKADAYSYNEEQFDDWLMSAVLIFVRRIQSERKEYAYNVLWTFPKAVAGIPYSHEIDFTSVSNKVTEKLREYGLRGRFFIIPEATALDSMFRNRVIHIALASEEEVQTNQNEEAQAKRHNQEEDAKAERNRAAIIQARRKYEAEKRSWDKEHSGFWGTISGWFSSEPREEYISPYTKQYVKVVKDRLHELKDFRNTGVDPKMPFGMLFLDAGGSTLDYCYIPEGESRGRIKSGSYLAGGRQVTEILMKLLGLDQFDVVEHQKVTAMSSNTYENPKLRDATITVYDKWLRDLNKKLEKRDKYLCVVCTGLAMRNFALRNLIRKQLSLASDQKLIWSEDIAAMANSAGATTEKYPDIAEFNLIVRNLQSGRQPSPACDVVGGLYFASKKEG